MSEIDTISDTHPRNDEDNGHPPGPKIAICIEGTSYPWNSRTITTEQIAGLGGWDASQGVIEVDKDQTERTLAPGEAITLRPGVSFGKKLCFKRG